MSSHIIIDARRSQDFGIGTYIRSLIHALATLDLHNRYTLIVGPEEGQGPKDLPENFKTAIYPRTDLNRLDNLAFPIFLRRLRPDLVHIPLNRVPVAMIRPYVVTVHDMSSLLFEEEGSDLRIRLHRYRYRRGLMRANAVIAV
ncbi:MAG TPA: glycosyltransferase, partial [Bryobacteraceae bacterium]|nr:glycosyltransferase [Bryobacteraceae bacterium]